jgi:hypothetical protein
MKSLLNCLFGPSRNAALLVVVGFFMNACAIVEPGAPAAAATVSARSEYEVMDVVERVFTTKGGYRIYAQTAGAITFERASTKLDRILYGDWMMGSDIAERVRVTISSKGDGKFRIRCTPLIVQHANDGDFEDAHRTAALFSFRYSKLLGEVKKDLK